MLPPRDIAPRVPARDLRADEALRIVALGTSLTARGSWTDRLAVRLSDCLARPVEITRITRPGATVVWASAPGRLSMLAAAEPHLVLVEFAINDADLRDGLARAEADRLTRALLRAIPEAAPGAMVVEMTMSPANGLRGMVRPGLAARYDDVIARAGPGQGGAVDLYRRWLALPRDERGLEDGLHPDPETAAAVIVPPLAAYVAELFGADCAVSPDSS